MPRRLRRAGVIFALVVVALLVAWRLPGCAIHPLQLDYVRAFDDPATRSVIVVAAFDGGSLAVIDSCGYSWKGAGGGAGGGVGELDLELRAKWFLARDGRTVRIGAFRVPYPPSAAGGAGGATPFSPKTVVVLGGDKPPHGPAPSEIEPMPAGFAPLVPIIDAQLRK